jgi:hypothetical protein
MNVPVIAHNAGCPGSNCPTTYGPTDRQTHIVQGTVVSAERAAELGIGPIPAGEVLVEVPDWLLTQHAQRRLEMA